ncbi:major capsid protein [Kingella denitrificans]|uniref:major capsid protein n=1 Tax=Kingella denitrificans TaxID=502 RepID=UPI0036F42E10
MKIMSKVNAAKAAFATGLTTFAVSANAALPDSVKNAIDGSKADGLEAGWIVVGVVAALFVIGIVKRMIR